MRVFAIIAGLSLALAARTALALDPNRSFEQLGRTAWTHENGAPTGITALAQTPDGYLWIGAVGGLYRFDGIHFERPPELQANRTQSDGVSALTVTRNGDLWIGHGWGGVTRLSHGVLAGADRVPDGNQVIRIVQTPDGAVWVAYMGSRMRAQLHRFLNGRWEIIKGGERGLPDVDMVDALAARDGTLWVALVDRVVRLVPGAQTFETVNDKVDEAENLAQDAAGRIWLLDASGPHALVGMPAQQTAIRRKDQAAGSTGDFIADRQGELWVASENRGIFRIRDAASLARNEAGSGPDRFEPNAAGSLGAPDALLEDREGNIWIGASGGLIRFRGVSITPYLRNAAAADLNKDIDLVAGQNGDFFTLWGNDTVSDLGRASIFSNHLGAFTKLRDGLAGVQNACTARNGIFWFADAAGLHAIGAGAAPDALPWPDQAKSKYMMACAQDKLGRLWVLMDRAGLFRFDGAGWRHFALPGADGVIPWLLAADPQGRILAYVKSGPLFRIDGDRADKLLDDAAIAIPELRFIYCVGNRIFLGGDGGLMVDAGGGFKTFPASRFAFLRGVAGMVQTGSGDIWISSGAGLVHLEKAAFDQENAGLAPRIYDFRDGLEGEPNRTEGNEVVQGGDGRVWVGTTEALAWIDPARLPHNNLPPQVLIRAVAANGRSLDTAGTLVLPAGTSKLQIEYTATSLSVPERVHFRYRLTGVDGDWVDAGTRRQAFYTNLEPGTYRFTVIAANDDGVWNMAGATTEFRVPPTFVQSNLFLALCGTSAALALWLLYRLRLNQLAARMRLRHEERLSERERIARELHDTLLQGVQSLIFRFQAVADCLPKDQSARELSEEALDRADQMVAEARDRVTQLRQTGTRDSLINVLQASTERILAGSHIEVSLTLEGTPRDLAGVIEEELVSIADEFLFNTLQHAAATQVDISLNYDRRALGLELCDNGTGIDPDTLNRGGRQGHFGLPGMRERAGRIGAEFALSSRPNAGVMISLRIPAAVAYKHNRNWIVPLPLKMLATAAE